MFSYLYEWIQNLAFYLVLVTAVIHMLPESGYKKYIRFFTGMILILLILTPILKILDMDKDITNIYQTSEYVQEILQIEEAEDLEKWQEVYEEMGEEEKGKIEVEEIQIGR